MFKVGKVLGTESVTAKVLHLEGYTYCIIVEWMLRLYNIIRQQGDVSEDCILQLYKGKGLGFIVTPVGGSSYSLHHYTSLSFKIISENLTS